VSQPHDFQIELGKPITATSDGTHDNYSFDAPPGQTLYLTSATIEGSNAFEWTLFGAGNHFINKGVLGNKVPVPSKLDWSGPYRLRIDGGRGPYGFTLTAATS
jgi:hypothetical protein